MKLHPVGFEKHSSRLNLADMVSVQQMSVARTSRDSSRSKRTVSVSIARVVWYAHKGGGNNFTLSKMRRSLLGVKTSASIAVQGQVNFKLNERGPCPCLFITSAEKVYSIFPIETKDINL